jgi:hypothetical protein
MNGAGHCAADDDLFLLKHGVPLGEMVNSKMQLVAL